MIHFLSLWLWLTESEFFFPTVALPHAKIQYIAETVGRRKRDLLVFFWYGRETLVEDLIMLYFTRIAP